MKTCTLYKDESRCRWWVRCGRWGQELGPEVKGADKEKNREKGLVG